METGEPTDLVCSRGFFVQDRSLTLLPVTTIIWWGLYLYIEKNDTR